MDKYTVTGIVVQGAPARPGASFVKTCKIKYEEMAGSDALVYIMDTRGRDKVVIVLSLQNRHFAQCFALHNVLQLTKIPDKSVRVQNNIYIIFCKTVH